MFRGRPKEWGPLDWGVALLAVLALVGGVIWFVQSRPGDCGDDLEPRGKDCVGVTAHAFETGDTAIDGLIRKVADENARVQRERDDPEGRQAPVPYARIALMMPFTADATSAMTHDTIRRGLAGALAAQQEANRAGGGPHYQLLLAPDGRGLDQWEDVVDRLDELAQDKKTPLIGVTGIPNSTAETRSAVADLSGRSIPTVGPVISATSLNYQYLFKTSPNNEEFVRALDAYLREHRGEGSGFLVWDTREGDVYTKDLRKVIKERFDDKYDLDNRNAHFVGSSGDDQGMTRRFSDAATKICGKKADTVFYAGRDQDLPYLINRLAGEGSCDHRHKLRILKVGTGLDPALTTEDVKGDLTTINATIVDASGYDPAWVKNRNTPPRGSAAFVARFQKLAKTYKLGGKALDDGYAAMYYDGFTLLAGAVDRTYSEVHDTGDQKSDPMLLPSAKDIYGTLTTATLDGSHCDRCLQGASGTYGFMGPGENDQWAVCKPVPIVEFPPGTGKPQPVYRTYRGGKAGACPS
ncbi:MULTISPECIES: ABC transporter substrate-binding protein [unclassified Streptomyces]|uniref:ABC transporter substrate-binding protein n=1 Tax=unclassified Streptomyces TaxID=2593676 RepID=UPI00278C7C44|nr:MULTISPECIES: ABC transporter substrate-binding protein [unclassified Streptomyces]